MNQKERTVLLFASILLLFVAFYLYTQYQPKQSLTDIRVGGTTGNTLIVFLPMYIAEKKGFFAEEGLNVTYMSLGPVSSTNVLLSGNEEFDGGFESPLLARIGGASLKTVLLYSGNDNFLFSNVSSLSDLKNKKIVVGCTGCLSYVRTINLLNKTGLSLNDVNIFAIQDSVQRLQAMKSGSAAAITNSFVNFKPNEFTQSIYLDQDYPYSVSGSIITTEDYIKNNPEIVMKFTTAIAKTVNYIYSDRQGTVSLIESGMSMDSERANYVYDFIVSNKFYFANLNTTSINTEIKDIAQATGKTPIPAEQFVDSTFFNSLPSDLKR